MKGNIPTRVYRLEIAAPSDEDNSAFLERLDRARSRLRDEGYDFYASRSDPATIARADALKRILNKARRPGVARH